MQGSKGAVQQDEGSNFFRMKNKYLMKFLCMTLISAMVLASPASALASAEEALMAGTEENTGTPTPEPTDTPESEPTDTPEPTVTPEPTITPEPSVTPEPTITPEPTVTPEPSQTPTPSPEPTPTPGLEEVTEAAQAVIDLIEQIPDEITLECEELIVKAENAYAELSEEEKAQVSNYKDLEESRKILDELKEKEEDTQKPDEENEIGSEDSGEGDGLDSVEDPADVQIGQRVTLGSAAISNLHAGKGFYLDSLEENYQLTFSDDFADMMDEIEQEYKEANKLSDVSDTTENHLTSSWDNLLVRNWQDILAIYIYQQAKEGVTEYNLDASAKEDLAEIFAMMNPVIRDKKNITKVSYGNYHINYYIKKNEISKEDREILKKHTETDCKLLCAIVTGAKGFVRQSVGDDVSEERVNVITAAYSLVGKVGYFWGGKSTVIGEDPRWGLAETVSVEGSNSTGSLRAYGLDCSGFVTWAVINGYLDQGMQSSIGDGTSDQWLKANTVSEEDAQPGDLVFQRGPESGSDNHVGIICGQTDSGDWIAVHCSSGQNGVTVGEAYSAGFRYIRQPDFYPTQEELDEIEKEKSQSTSILSSSGENKDTELKNRGGQSSKSKSLTILEDDSKTESKAKSETKGLEVLD